MFICTQVAFLLSIVVGQIVLQCKNKPYNPQDDRFYQSEKQIAKRDRIKEALTEMEILQKTQESQAQISAWDLHKT